MSIKSFGYFDDLNKNYLGILNSIKRVLSSGNLILGPEVNKFEKKFSKFIGSKYGIGVGNCTDAIYIALKAFNIKQGDEVLTVANTAIPTITAIVNTGAVPKFVDVNENYLIDSRKIVQAINKRTKAIIPVHLYGKTCDMNEIMKIAKKYKLKIIEDCAQSTGSSYNKKKSGNFGDIGCFSFYPTKILGAFGDGGFITTNNFKLFKKMKRIRFMGIEQNKKKYFAYEQGTNSRLDEIHASVLNFKLKYLKNQISKRIKNANKYRKLLKKTNLILPKIEKDKQDVYYEFVVRSKKRNKILNELKKKEINLKITYEYPIYKMKPYSEFYNKNLINTEKYSKEIFSLPIYNGIKDKDIEIVCKNLINLVK